jgi:hypothetical protein
MTQANFLQCSNFVILSTHFSIDKLLSRLFLSLVQDRGHTHFVSEANTDTIALQDHVPRAVCKMYLRAKHLGSVACSPHLIIHVTTTLR